MKKRRNGKLSKALNLAIKVPLAVAVLSTALHFGNNLYNKINPSSQREQFEEHFGFSLNGSRSSIEKNGNLLLRISSVVNYEMQQKPFDVRSITVRPEHVIFQPFWNQVSYIISGGNEGYFNPITDNISLSYKFGTDNLCHEIKHAKTLDIIKNNPEFLDEWRALSLDENGNSLYLNIGEQLCFRVRGLEGILENKSQEECIKDGFITPYAGTNVYEDIAELCQTAEFFPTSLSDFLEGFEDHNPAIVSKIKIAEKYGLIPEDFSEFARTDRYFNDNFVESSYHSCYVLREKIKPAINLWENYLNENPDSVYKAKILNNMALAMKSGIYGDNPLFSIDEVIDKYKEVLNLPKYPLAIDSYPYTLVSLEIAYSDKGDYEKAKLYRDALREYQRRYDANDLSIIKNGVNDFLTERGENIK